MQALLRFIHFFSVQIAQTAVANGHTIVERLARWMVMCIAMEKRRCHAKFTRNIFSAVMIA